MSYLPNGKPTGMELKVNLTLLFHVTYFPKQQLLLPVLRQTMSSEPFSHRVTRSWFQEPLGGGDEVVEVKQLTILLMVCLSKTRKINLYGLPLWYKENQQITMVCLSDTRKINKSLWSASLIQGKPINHYDLPLWYQQIIMVCLTNTRNMNK